MIYWQLFLAFFIPGILGYGGGPASIPLIEHEVVENYEWMTTQEFSEVVALGNSLPGPIATKMAGYIGYAEGGILGATIALFATVAPSLILMISMMAVLLKYKEAPEVKNLTKLIRPVIAVLLGVMTIQFAQESLDGIGIISTLILIVGSYLLLEKVELHPAFVIIIALAYGAVIV
ncbi:chromate transporter [Psychrobacillus sp. FSL K6-2684]|uniref:Chromate transporter n=1 Tax=Psychrobacillus faecigallinarum TaxID=2762235 RepID=A0ABR8RCF8_9BACI|nr:chromate transporter [Psychrobacillus faecigallinarum]MBD7945483.1 chromate transporter [Psychrobacillus faecigallinarum]QGM32131.1 chromate transporter [Bacillus sp. N3536]